MSLDKWVEGFERDMHPEQEIEFWERLSAAYTNAAAGPNLTAEQRKKLFKKILSIAIGVPDEAN